MDFNIATLEIADHITHFDYYDTLVSDTLRKTDVPTDEQTRIRQKSREHLEQFFSGAEFYTANKQLRPLAELIVPIKAKLQGMKTKDIHELIEKLEKDARKIRKLYKSLAGN